MADIETDPRTGQPIAQRPPRADEPLSPGDQRMQDEQGYALPGTRRAAEIAQAEAQQPWTQDIVDGFKSTAAYGVGRLVRDEGLGALIGQDLDTPDYDKEKQYDELTQGIPFEYHDDILANNRLESAQRSRQRILEDLQRGQRMAQQNNGHLAMLAGSVVDVDLPLAMMSGGAYGSAKLARGVIRAGRLARMSPRATLRTSGAAQGLNAGLQAGLVVGSAEAAYRETAEWTDLANTALTMMAFGGVVGGAAGGDAKLMHKMANEEFLRRVQIDAPEYRQTPDVNQLPSENLAGYLEAPADDSVGAASMGTAQGNQPGVNPDLSPTNMQWIKAAEQWRHDSGWADRKARDDDEWWGKIAAHTGMNLTTSNFNTLYKSNSSVANFIAGNIFESTNGLGRGRATAATQMENYHRRIQSHLNAKVEGPMSEWAKRNKYTWQNSGHYISDEGKAVFNREVMIELNNRRLGRKETYDPDIKRAADQYEAAGQESLNIGRGRDGETSVAGFEEIPDTRGYTPYKWSGRRIRQLIDNGVVREQNILTAMADAYKNAGLATGKDADAIAKAVIHRAMAKEDGVDMSVMSLMSGDGKDFMREGLLLGGLGEAQADAILDRLTGAQHNRSKEGFAKTRNDIDMDVSIQAENGEDIRIVDLFDNDLHGVWQRYSRQMSGSAALARHGITNRAQRTEIIDAMIAEMRAKGETPPEKELMEAMFSHFNAGPIHGYTRMQGRNEGIGEVALMKRITNLALLNKLGITQLAETGVMIAQNGLENWLRRGPGAWLDSEIKAGNKELLDDLAFITGDIGQDHWHFAPWLDLDDVSTADRGRFMKAVHKYTSNASFIQGYTSVFNQVRSFQQQTAVLGMADKVFRELKKAVDEGRDLDEGLLGRFENDLGLFREDVQALEQLVSSGVIEFKTRGKQTFVNRLNVDQWDGSIADVFASAVTRNMNQLVQKSMAGEQDAWMHSHFGSLMTHLMTFPLQAMQKQAMRNFRYMDKQAMGAVLYGLATAGIMVKIKDAIDGRERDWKDTAHAAVNYSNMTGFLPMIYDPIMSMLGMDDARVNQYGPHYDFTPPVLSVGQNMLRAPGALGNVVQGDADWYDQQALKALPFANAYFLNRIFE